VWTAGGRYNHDSYSGTVATFYNCMGVRLSSATAGQATGKVELQYDLAPNRTVYASVTHGYKPGGSTIIQVQYRSRTKFRPEGINAINRFKEPFP